MRRIPSLRPIRVPLCCNVEPRNHFIPGVATVSVGNAVAENRCGPGREQGGHAMGRGRAKAKQTKVARALKYSTPTTDLSALEQELRGSQNQWSERESDAADTENEDDEYGRWSSAGT